MQDYKQQFKNKKITIMGLGIFGAGFGIYKIFGRMWSRIDSNGFKIRRTIVDFYKKN